ncbi:hypothetical protein CAK95_15670 [Pseudorhodoplanes sinuspersici]|uniref:HTH luxR-type domain-containing protein n=2 Tax=Pseudorhodoplanes sinuspersici TaxID=1235591 RepID=A0A1W6ZSK5_9HYPH|nr:hypothetical protein CAK95_15670 [Pseudorhodoplanes sinuspersici]
MLIARLLAVHVTKETETNEAALVLSGAGFDDSDVAQMLGITESTVRGIRFRNNKPKRKKSKRG